LRCGYAAGQPCIIIPFDGYTSRYIWHCHFLEHEDSEIMRPFDVAGEAKRTDGSGPDAALSRLMKRINNSQSEPTDEFTGLSPNPATCENGNPMGATKLKTAFIVGAGFSSYAELPLTAGFTDAILAARQFEGGPSKLAVDLASRFIRDSFDHSTRARGNKWPDLEDVFTCVDLSANSGHHLGRAFAPADLRTILGLFFRESFECSIRVTPKVED